MIECAFCDNEGIHWDSDLGMALCGQHNAEMSGIADFDVEEIL